MTSFHLIMVPSLMMLSLNFSMYFIICSFVFNLQRLPITRRTHCEEEKNRRQKCLIPWFIGVFVKRVCRELNEGTRSMNQLACLIQNSFSSLAWIISLKQFERTVLKLMLSSTVSSFDPLYTYLYLFTTDVSNIIYEDGFQGCGRGGSACMVTDFVVACVIWWLGLKGRWREWLSDQQKQKGECISAKNEFQEGKSLLTAWHLLESWENRLQSQKYQF